MTPITFSSNALQALHFVVLNIKTMTQVVKFSGTLHNKFQWIQAAFSRIILRLTSIYLYFLSVMKVILSHYIIYTISECMVAHFL